MRLGEHTSSVILGCHNSGLIVMRGLSNAGILEQLLIRYLLGIANRQINICQCALLPYCTLKYNSTLSVEMSNISR